MVAISKHPVNVLNKYVWELLKINLGLTETDYADADVSARVPITPSGQDAAFVAIDKPFLVYGYSEDGTPDLYARYTGSLSYAVWSTSVAEINSILNVIRTAMERRDESAGAVNRWSSKPGSTNIGIRFGDISIGYLEGPSPEESDGGRQAGIITLRYQYFVDYDVTLPV